MLTGGSGIAMGLPDNFRAAGKLADYAPRETLTAPAGKPVVLAGSCSQATREQIRVAIAAGAPAIQVDPLAIAKGAADAARIAAWVRENTSDRPAVVYSSADPAEVREVQGKLGAERAGALVESLLAEVGASLLADGFSRFVVAGGETSGAVVGALGVRALEDRAGDRSRRALDPQPRRAGRRAGAEVGKFRHRRISFEGVDKLS